MNTLGKRSCLTGGGRQALSGRAFTLVEIVITLSVLAVLIGISVPAISGLQRQHEARQPVAELVRMARTVRARAMREQHPYQIVFDQQGFYAAEYFSPYGGKQEFDAWLQALEAVEKAREMEAASKKRLGDLSEGAGVAQGALSEGDGLAGVYHQTYQLPQGVDYEIMMRGDHDWVAMQGAVFKRWVFQSSGMCDPFKIRIQAQGSFFEVGFHPLTGDINEEKSYVE